MKNTAMVPLGLPILMVGLAFVQGCSLPGYAKVDRDLRDLEQEASAPHRPHAVDALATALADSRMANQPASATVSSSPPPPPTSEVKSAAFHQPAKSAPPEKDPKEKKPPDLLAIPPGLPGADAPSLKFTEPNPKFPNDRTKDRTLTLPERLKRIDDFYPPTPPLPPETPPAPGPEGHPMTLSDLQRLAESYSPAIKSAQAAVTAAKGAAVQAGMYPNPTFSFENDTIQTVPAGYPGFQIEQVIKTGGKLKLAQAAALMDVLNAKVALRRALTDLHYGVRSAYFAVLVARENARVSAALFRFTETIYRIQVEQLKRGGFAAAYEPGQLRPLVLGARLAVLQARNQYRTSWRQLAAALGLPDMPPSELVGRVDMPVPVFDYDQVRAHVFANHTDVLTAENNIRRAKYVLESAKLVPLPDVDARLLVQKDYTTPPNQISASVQLAIPVPIWDQNKGGIRQAEALLAQSLVGPDQARNTLVATALADAFNRYETGRLTVEVASQQVRDQLHAYIGVYRRRNQDPTAVGFGDVVTAQQTLAGFIAGYITALGVQWQAVVDVANVLQTDDLFQFAHTQEMLLIPDLADLEYDYKHTKHASPGAGPVTHHEPASTSEISARWLDPHSQPAPGSPVPHDPGWQAAPQGVAPPARLPEITPASGPPR